MWTEVTRPFRLQGLSLPYQAATFLFLKKIVTNFSIEYNNTTPYLGSSVYRWVTKIPLNDTTDTNGPADRDLLTRAFGKPSTRMIAEAVEVEELPDENSLNSKSEWTFLKLPRVNVI